MRNPLFALLVSSSLAFVAAETGIDGWLRYAPLSSSLAKSFSSRTPSNIALLNATTNGPVSTAGTELQKGIQGILGKKTTIGTQKCNAASTVFVGTFDAFTAACGAIQNAPQLGEDGYWLSVKGSSVKILGQNERGALYGAFEYLSQLGQGQLSDTTFASSPSAPIRWANQWDNLDNTTSTQGSIERGYGGPSIFFSNGGVNQDLTRVAQYGRLLASVGLNGVIVNNVNANATLLTPENQEGLKRIADTLRPFGVRMGISLNFASPQLLGGLPTFDPLDPTVIDWWQNITDSLYSLIPDFAGYLVKANSEGQPGPLTYNRTLADGANLFAKSLAPHGGVVMFRAFVYDLLNETDWKADRANAQIQFFSGLDGKFDDNVVIQIKYGPIDFQVREPTSPLFAHLPNTASAIELQVTQEYLGQQCHLVFLPPLWKTVLDFDLKVDNQPTVVSNILSGQRFNKKLGGYAGVVNVGQDPTWMGSHVAMSNFYSFGRLAWNPNSDPQSILQDWIRLTFSSDPTVVDTITTISMASWPAYEQYSGNLGIQTLTDILGPHFGPKPASQDDNGYGQWTRADKKTIGMDRTVANGTGFSGNYPPAVHAVYESLEDTPDNLLLWFHHVNYTHRLHSGETVIQDFYNAHYEGSATAQTFVPLWESLKGKIDDERFNHQLYRQVYQAGHSLVWRDSITTFYHNLSGIPDTLKRVGNHPFRIEAEQMAFDSGFKLTFILPPEAASNSTGIMTSTNSTVGTATTKLNFPSGTYNVAVNYFDLKGGQAKYQLFLNDQQIGTWVGDSETHLGHTWSPYYDAHTAIRITFPNVSVKKGDTLKIVGTGDGIEPAGIDYISILPPGIID